MFEIGQQIRQKYIHFRICRSQTDKMTNPVFSSNLHFANLCTLRINFNLFGKEKKHVFYIKKHVFYIKKSFTSMTNIFFAQSMTSTKRRKPKPINIPKVP